jgi:hypothetical protein
VEEESVLNDKAAGEGMSDGLIIWLHKISYPLTFKAVHASKGQSQSREVANIYHRKWNFVLVRSADHIRSGWCLIRVFVFFCVSGLVVDVSTDIAAQVDRLLKTGAGLVVRILLSHPRPGGLELSGIDGEHLLANITQRTNGERPKVFQMLGIHIVKRMESDFSTFSQSRKEIDVTSEEKLSRPS